MIWQVPLGDPPPDLRSFASGCVVAADGCLRVVHGWMLRSVHPSGRILWKRSLRLRCRRLLGYGLPLALDDGSTWVTSNRRLLREHGGRLKLVARGQLGDESAVSPNLGYDGSIYCGGVDRASRWHHGLVTILDEDGFDIFTPAVYPDGSVGLASYYGNGLCRRKPDGRMVFRVKTKSREQDGLVTINDCNEAACRSLNDRCSLVVDAKGKVLWTLDRPAIFSCIPDPERGWLALADGALTRLNPSGRALWTRQVPEARGNRPYQAIVDNRGLIYVPFARGMVAFDPHGRQLFATDYPEGEVSALCPLAPGQMALIHNGCLYLLGDR